MSNQEEFRSLNEVLMNVLKRALGHLKGHNPQYKKYCLQAAAWDGAEELKKLADSLSEPFSAPVEICLRKCDEAMAKMPAVHVELDEYSMAAENFIDLVETVDMILGRDPSYREGIGNDDLASHLQYVTLAGFVSQL